MMKELGNVLRSRREKLGLTLSDMEKQTKIRQRYLIALEEGDWSPLPGYVYARGFVRSYAEQLGLDGRALLKQYVDDVDEDGTVQGGEQQAGLQKQREPINNKMRDEPKAVLRKEDDLQPQEEKQSVAAVTDRYKTRERQTRVVEPISASQFSRSSRQRNRRKVSRGGSRGWVGQTVAIVAILAVISAGLWIVDHRNHPHTSYGAGANANVPGSTVATNTKGKAKTGNTKIASSSKQNQGSSKTQNPSAPPSAVTVTAVPLQGNVLKYLVQTQKPLTVVLSSPIARLWTEVTADGKIIDEETLSQGDLKQFSAKNTISFVIGNPPAAQFAVDGKSIVLPNPGKTVTVEFVKVSG